MLGTSLSETKKLHLLIFHFQFCESDILIKSNLEQCLDWQYLRSKGSVCSRSRIVTRSCDAKLRVNESRPYSQSFLHHTYTTRHAMFVRKMFLLRLSIKANIIYWFSRFSVRRIPRLSCFIIHFTSVVAPLLSFYLPFEDLLRLILFAPSGRHERHDYLCCAIGSTLSSSAGKLID